MPDYSTETSNTIFDCVNRIIKCCDEMDDLQNGHLDEATYQKLKSTLADIRSATAPLDVEGELFIEIVQSEPFSDNDD